MREIIDLIIGIINIVITIVPPFVVWKAKSDDVKAGAIFIFLLAIVSNAVLGFAYMASETIELLI